VEGLKSSQKKSEKKVAEKEELSERQKESLKNLHEELENIRKKAALDEIKKKILRREALEQEWAKEASARSQSQGAVGSGSATGTGSGTGTGSAGSPTGGSPWGSSSGGSALESRLSDYYDSIWAKIKKEWTLPENLPKGTTLETTIVIVIDREGKIQKSWFERKSGNSLFDQRAMRAIKKAEPLPPIPKEFSDSTLEMGFRFHPD
jgi:TolA protein